MGVEGIYNTHDLIVEHGDAYKEFICGAGFSGEDGCEGLKDGVKGYRGLVVIAHSDNDELIGWRQAEGWKCVCEDSVGVGGGVRMVKVSGMHDEVLEKRGLAEVVVRYLLETFTDLHL